MDLIADFAFRLPVTVNCAAEALLANDNDRSAAPRTGTAFLWSFRCGVSFGCGRAAVSYASRASTRMEAMSGRTARQVSVREKPDRDLSGVELRSVTF
jgi:hypothetical protein